jgi:hypothetical protein
MRDPWAARVRLCCWLLAVKSQTGGMVPRRALAVLMQMSSGDEAESLDMVSSTASWDLHRYIERSHCLWGFHDEPSGP